MKTISKRISALLIVIVMLFVMTSSAFAETEDIDVQYDYPLTPDDGEQWRSLLTLDAMVNACDVPSERLNRMTTRALVETVLDYPLLLNMVAYNTIQLGFESVLSYCNSLQELTKRSDAIEELENLAAELNAGGILDVGTIAPELEETLVRYVYATLLLSEIKAMGSVTTGSFLDNNYSFLRTGTSKKMALLYLSQRDANDGA